MPTYSEVGSSIVVSSDTYDDNLYVSEVDKIPIARYLPEKFRKVQLYKDLIGVIQKYIVYENQDTLSRLRQFRDSFLIEDDFLEKLAGTLGFYQDISNKTSAQKRRIIQNLTKFYERNGTRFTFEFLNWVSEESLTVTPLYTQNHVDFFTSPGGTMEPSGPWYLSGHVDIDYAAASALSSDEISQRFYQLAPVPLIIRNISKVDILSQNLPILGSGFLTGEETFLTDYGFYAPGSGSDYIFGTYNVVEGSLFAFISGFSVSSSTYKVTGVPNWNVIITISSKSLTNFLFQVFDVPAPAGASIDWVINISQFSGGYQQGTTSPTTDSTTHQVTGLTSLSSTNYAVLVCPSWTTHVKLTARTTTTFDIAFSYPCPSGGFFDWKVIPYGTYCNTVSPATDAGTHTVSGLTGLTNNTYKMIGVTPSWETNIWVTNKTTTSFVLNFSNPCPSGGTVVWALQP